MNKIFAVTILFLCCIITYGQQNKVVQTTSNKNDIPELIPVVRNRKYGYINTKGRLMIPAKFNLALFLPKIAILHSRQMRRLDCMAGRIMLQ